MPLVPVTSYGAAWNPLRNSRIHICFFGALIIFAWFSPTAKGADFHAAALMEVVKSGATSGIFGFGGRFSYEFQNGIGLESQVTRGIGIGDGTHGEILGTFGLRYTKSLGSVGLFGVARPGVLQCGFANCGLNSATRHFVATFAGGGFELAGRGGGLFRVDYGDTLINLGRVPALRAPARAAGWTHNRTLNLSVGFRF